MAAAQETGFEEYVLKGNATFIASAISRVVIMAANGKPLAIVFAHVTKIKKKKMEK